MTQNSLEKTSRQIEQTFLARTEKSKARDRLARKYLPGGDTRSTLYLYIVSTPMSEKEVDQAIGAFEETLELVKPAVREGWPHLMAT